MQSNNLHYYFTPEKNETKTVETDVCVYGGTSGGVMAAVQAARMGLRVVLLENSDHVGGMTTGGLSNTDIGNKTAIGGLALEFYQRVGRHYGLPEEWRFEPHVAEKVMLAMLEETEVSVYHRQFLHSVQKEHEQLRAITFESGLTIRADMFLDCSYEGDLMAAAGISFTVGRESNVEYGETINGAQMHHKHQFELPVDPYVMVGDPTSGLLPGIEDSVVEMGVGDGRVQAYNFRMCLTQVEDNRIPFAKPQGYDPQLYELLARYLEAGWDLNCVFKKFDPIRNQKTDTNNHGAVSTDFIGMNHLYPLADYSTREKIFQQHVTYQQGLMWFLANDKRVPQGVRKKMSTWGLCRDEFQDAGGWSRSLYIREARRMVSDYVMTEAHCRGKRIAEHPVALAAYTMDSHNCRRVVVDGVVRNEGDVQVKGFPPYPIAYESIVPRKRECANLLVPFCLSASHIAFGSIRMEPVFMELSQSAVIAAKIALDARCALQDIAWDELHEALLEHGQKLSWTPGVDSHETNPNPPLVALKE